MALSINEQPAAIANAWVRCHIKRRALYVLFAANGNLIAMGKRGDLEPLTTSDARCRDGWWIFRYAQRQLVAQKPVRRKRGA